MAEVSRRSRPAVLTARRGSLRRSSGGDPAARSTRVLSSGLTRGSSPRAKPRREQPLGGDPPWGAAGPGQPRELGHKLGDVGGRQSERWCRPHSERRCWCRSRRSGRRPAFTFASASARGARRSPSGATSRGVLRSCVMRTKGLTGCPLRRGVPARAGGHFRAQDRTSRWASARLTLFARATPGTLLPRGRRPRLGRLRG